MRHGLGATFSGETLKSDWILADVHMTGYPFDSYSVERSAVGDQVLKMVATLTTVGTMKNPVAQTLRNLVGHIILGISPAQHAFADAMTEVTISYPRSPLNGPSLPGAGPKPGQRVGPLSGQVPVGAGSAPRFALFAATTTGRG